MAVAQVQTREHDEARERRIATGYSGSRTAVPRSLRLRLVALTPFAILLARTRP
jgi:hypothetical protein